MRDEALDVIPRPDCPSSVDGRLASAAARYVGGLADLPAACAAALEALRWRARRIPLSSTIVGIVGIMDLPDNVIAAAMSMVVSAGGGSRRAKRRRS